MSTGPVDGLISVERRQPWLKSGRRRPRRLLLIGVVVGTAWSLLDAGLGQVAVVNPDGWPQLRSFIAAAARPEINPAFLRLVAEATLVTAAYAVLGTALALLIGIVGGLIASAIFWHGKSRSARWPGFLSTRLALTLPRGLHEAVWAILLVNLLGLDPLVAVLAIGLPYGAITAKVYADLLDEAPRTMYRALQGAGASRPQALLYGLLPLAAPDLLSYAFYRLECSVRSAIVLGVIGAGGLGFELELSFSALRYGEMWTIIAALVLLCAAAETASSIVRGRLARPRTRTRTDALGTLLPRRDPVIGIALALAAALLVWSWVFLRIEPATLWSPRLFAQVEYLATAAWPPKADFETLWRYTVQTFQMSLLAIVLAFGTALGAACLAARTANAGVGRRLAAGIVRSLLLIARALPPPVWALLVLFVFYPGPLSGAVALAAYNAGVLGRLMAEAQEGLPQPALWALRAQGARRSTVCYTACSRELFPKTSPTGSTAGRWRPVRLSSSGWWGPPVSVSCWAAKRPLSTGPE